MRGGAARCSAYRVGAGVDRGTGAGSLRPLVRAGPGSRQAAFSLPSRDPGGAGESQDV